MDFIGFNLLVSPVCFGVVINLTSIIADITADIIQGFEATSIPEITTNSTITINY